MSFNLDNLYRQVIMDHYKNPRNKGTIEDQSLTIDMNNPTCGDSIHLTMKVDDGKVTDAKFEGEGCSISMASASMMTQAIIGQDVDTAVKLSGLFSEMVQGKDIDEELEKLDFSDEELDLGDIEALSGVSKFPARIKCATLAWKAMEKGIKEQQ